MNFPPALNPQVFRDTAKLMAKLTSDCDTLEGTVRSRCALRMILNVCKPVAPALYHQSFFAAMMRPKRVNKYSPWWWEYEEKIIALLLCAEIAEDYK